MCHISKISSPGYGHAELHPRAVAQIPQHPACDESLGLAQRELSAPLFNHSFRVFLYARAFIAGENENPKQRDATPSATLLASLFVACILHDLGTSNRFDESSDRFKVCGADGVAALLRKYNFSETESEQAWLAIAIHTSPGIAERIPGIVRAVRLGVRADFRSYPRPMTLSGVTPDEQALLLDGLPRLEIEKVLGDAVVRQTMQRPEKAPKASWPGDLQCSKETYPQWNGVNKAF